MIQYCNDSVLQNLSLPEEKGRAELNDDEAVVGISSVLR